MLSTVTANIEYPDFNSIQDLTLNGDTRQFNNVLRIVPAIASMTGSAYHNDKQFIEMGFVSTFQFQCGNTGPWGGADGFAFLIQNESLTSLGTGGGDLGYTGIGNSLAIEFDIFNNSTHADPNANHISVNSAGGGITPNSSHHSYSLGYANPSADINDGAVHDIKIVYESAKLSIYFDDMMTPLLEVDVDLSTKLNLDSGKAWLGFVGATGGSYIDADILNWTVESESLIADVYEIQLKGGVVNFDLEAGKANAARLYLILGSISGTTPGIPLPGGNVVLPVNWDLFTNVVLDNLSTPLFVKFLGMLDADGKAKAKFDTISALPSILLGYHFYFAYGLNSPWDFVSNPVAIEVAP